MVVNEVGGSADEILVYLCEDTFYQCPACFFGQRLLQLSGCFNQGIRFYGITRIRRGEHDNDFVLNLEIIKNLDGIL